MIKTETNISAVVNGKRKLVNMIQGEGGNNIVGDILDANAVDEKIDAAVSGDSQISQNYVAVNKQQSFTDTQKRTARENIGASSLTDFQMIMSQLADLRTKDNFITKNLGYTGILMRTGEAKALEAETSGDASVAWVIFTYGDENSPITAMIHQKHGETTTVQTIFFENKVANRTITFTDNKRTSIESTTAWNTITNLLGVQATQNNIVLRLMNSHLDGSQGLYTLTLPAVSATQAGVMTPQQMNTLNSGVKEMINITYASLKNLRDNSLLKPGQFYRITDYVTTTIQEDTRSAGHAFDIIVRADSVNTLNEQASAIQHQDDTYFNNTNMEAWELKYKLDNVLWSLHICTIISDANDGFRFESIGTVSIEGQTYILWDASEAEADYDVNRVVSLTKEPGAEMLEYDSQTGTIIKDRYTAYIEEVVGEWDEEGKGTIIYMKDEYNNECSYDFKNIQYKRYMTTDTVSGRSGFDGKYMVSFDNHPDNLTIENENDFIWTYTFSSNSNGGEQTDYSLGGHNVHDNSFCFRDELNYRLPNNVTFGGAIYYNKLGNACTNNSFGNYCFYNSLGDYCIGNCFSVAFQYNSFGASCSYNSFGRGCTYNSFGASCLYNSFNNDCHHNFFSGICDNNSFGRSCINNTVFNYVQYIQITADSVRNIQILNGVSGKSSSKLTLPFASSKNYTQVAAMNSNGALKIYVPGDLVK